MTMAEDEGRPASGASGSEQVRPAKPGERSTPSKEGQRQGDIQTYIGSRLRQAFDDIASQPIPDRFLQLMQDLDKV